VLYVESLDTREDGEPLDILVLMDAPAHGGCLIDTRLIGILNAEQSLTDCCRW
jgi:inorganic pyrophosphatase